MDNITITVNSDDKVLSQKIAILGDVAVGKSSIAQR